MVEHLECSWQVLWRQATLSEDTKNKRKRMKIILSFEFCTKKCVRFRLMKNHIAAIPLNSGMPSSFSMIARKFGRLAWLGCVIDERSSFRGPDKS
jgi:hypothetical protein